MKKQNIIDLDMDFFLEDISTEVISPQERITDDDESLAPKGRNYIVDFLENKLGLSKERKIQGKIVEHHQEALNYWHDLVLGNELWVPFNLVHVDAHSDLMYRPSNCQQIFNLLGFEVDSRYDYMIKNDIRPKCGDYLIFAIVFRWLNSLTYVVHPKGNGSDFFPFLLEYKPPKKKESGYNYFKVLFHENESGDGFIQLPYNPKDDYLKLVNWETQKEYIDASTLEPKVAFEVTNKYDEINHKGDFDFLVFSKSPNYTPASADFIIDIISEYIVSI